MMKNISIIHVTPTRTGILTKNACPSVTSCCAMIAYETTIQRPNCIYIKNTGYTVLANGQTQFRIVSHKRLPYGKM